MNQFLVKELKIIPKKRFRSIFNKEY